MAMAPIDFNITVPQPNLAPYLQARAVNLANIQQSIGQLGGTIAQVVAGAQQQEKQRQAQMQFASDMQAYMQDPSAKNYTMILTRYPQLKDQMAKAHEAMGEEQRQAQLSVFQPAYAAFSSGDIGTATQMLAERRTALQNAGKTAQAQNVDSLIKSIDENPNAARMQFHMVLGGLLGPEKAAESFKMFEMMPTEARKAEAEAGIKEAEKAIKDIEIQRLPAKLGLADSKTQAEINNYNSQIKDRADRLLLDGYKSVNEANAKAAEILQRNQDIPKVFVEKMVEFQDNAVLSSGIANKAYDLSIRFQTTQMPSGAEARFDKWLDDQIGVRDAQGVLRKEYEALTTDKTIQKLGGLKGAASDRDVALVQSTNLSSISDPKVLSSWLAGLAKLHAVSRSVNEIRSEWIEMNGSKGTAKAQQDMIIGGYDVPRGMTLSRFEEMYGDKIFADAVRSLEFGYLTRSSYMQGVDINAPEQEFSQQGYGEGMSFPPEEQ